MAITVQVTEADLQVGRVLDDKWYQLRVVKVDTAPRKDNKPGINYVIDFEVISGEDGLGDASGLQLRRFFPSLGWLAPLLKTKDIILEKGMNLDLSGLEDHTFDGKIKPGAEYNGRINNDLYDFAKLGEKFGK